MIVEHTTITSGGKLIIPSSIRKALNLKSGEKVHLILESGELRVISYKNAILRAQQLIRKYNKKNSCLTKELFNIRNTGRSNK